MPPKSKAKQLNTVIHGEAFLRLEKLKNKLSVSNYTEALNVAVTRTLKSEGIKV